MVWVRGFFCVLTAGAKEKEARIKEGMLIMGMRPSVFWLGWAITAVITSLYVSILVIVSGACPVSFSAISTLLKSRQALMWYLLCLPSVLQLSRSACTPSASSLSSSLSTRSQTAPILEGVVTRISFFSA
jgi:hypothetical protein